MFPRRNLTFVSPRTVNSFPFAIVKVPLSGSIFVTSLLLLHVASFKTLTVASVSSNIQVTLWFAIPVTCCWQNLVIYTSRVVYFIGDHGFSSHYSRSHGDCLAPSSVSLFFVWTISSEVARFAASKTYHLVPAPRGRSRFSFSFQLTNLLIHIKHELLELTNFRWNFSLSAEPLTAFTDVFWLTAQPDKLYGHFLIDKQFSTNSITLSANPSKFSFGFWRLARNFEPPNRHAVLVSSAWIPFP